MDAPHDVAKVLWDKLSAKYSCASAWSSILPMTFWLSPHLLHTTDQSSVVLKFFNGGYAHIQGRSFGKRQLPFASVVNMFVGKPFLAELLDLGGAGGQERLVAAHLFQTFEAAMNTNIWVSERGGEELFLTRFPGSRESFFTVSLLSDITRRILSCDVEIESPISVYIHCRIYAPDAAKYSQDAVRVMTVGVCPRDVVEWTPRRHLLFPAEIRACVFGLLLAHRRRECALSALPRGVLLNVIRFIPQVWETSCFAAIRRTGIACGGGFVSMAASNPHQLTVCDHSLLICKNHFHARPPDVFSPPNPWWRCLQACTTPWMLEWSGLGVATHVPHVHRRFFRGLLLRNGSVVSAESDGLLLVETATRSHEVWEEKEVELSIPGDDDAGKLARVFSWVGPALPNAERPPLPLAYVTSREAGFVVEAAGGGGARSVVAFARWDVCLCVSEDSVAQMERAPPVAMWPAPTRLKHTK